VFSRRLEGSKPVLSASKEGEAGFGTPEEYVAILMNQSPKLWESRQNRRRHQRASTGLYCDKPGIC